MPMTKGRFLLSCCMHVEGVHNHGGEIGSFALACDDLRNVIELLRVGYRQDAAPAGLHPDGLVVMAPVKQIAIAGLLQKIRGERRLRYPRAEPTLRTFAGMLFDCRRRFGNQRKLFRFGQGALTLGICPAVPDDLGVVECGDCLRRVAIHFCIDQKRYRQFQIGKELRQAKDTDTIAVVAPGVVEDVGLRSARRQLRAQPFAKREPLEVKADVDGEALAAGPVVDRPGGDWRVRIAVVGSNWHC